MTQLLLELDPRSPEELRQAHQALEALFGRRVWFTKVYRGRTPSGICISRGCDQPAARRIRLNVWGVARECDVCLAHAVFPDGRSRDGAYVDEP